MSEETTAVALRDQSTELSVDQIKSQVNLIQQVMREVLQEGVHYGKIPGTDKPTLLKPGAEKLGMTFRLAPEFDEMVVDLGNGHRDYRFVCRLRNIVTGALVGSGVGSCSTMESKYRWRKLQRVCPKCGAEAVINGKEEFGGGYLCWKKRDGCGATFKVGDPAIESQETGRKENEDIADVYNTVLKMAKKRAHIDAMLTATAASDIFTQDLDETIGKPTQNNDGAAMLAKLFVTLTIALRDKKLTQKQFADTALGLDAYLEKHPDANVSDYTSTIEKKLAKKDVTPGPTQSSSTTATGATTHTDKPEDQPNTTPDTDDAGGPAQEPDTDSKGKAEMGETIDRMQGKAAASEDPAELDIF